MAEQTEFEAKVVQINTLQVHPNADRLEIVDVDGFPVVVRKGDFKPGDYAVYIPVDALVPTSRPEFAFLAKTGLQSERHRVRASRLRGVFSMGLLIPGDKYRGVSDVASALGIEKYISPQERALLGREQKTEALRAARKAGGLNLPVYGLDTARKYAGVLQDGEEIIVTEKIHGCNARYCYSKGRLWVGSHKVMRGCSPSWLRTRWQQVKAHVLEFFGFKHRSHLVKDAGDVWWEIAQKYDLERKLAAHPDMVLYGEIYGDKVQDLTYGCNVNERKFIAFDVLDRKTGQFLDYDEFQDFVGSPGLGLPRVPVIAHGRFGADLSLDDLWAKAEGKTFLGGRHIREGVVVKPKKERVDLSVGRVALKFVGQGYLFRSEAPAANDDVQAPTLIKAVAK